MPLYDTHDYPLGMFCPLSGLSDGTLDVIIDRAFRAARMTLDVGRYPEPPKVGDRVRLRREVNKYPHFVAERGMTGTVVVSDADEITGIICVRMDETLSGAEEWHNEIYWTSDDDEVLDSGREPYAAVPFWADCARIVSRIDLPDLQAELES